MILATLAAYHNSLSGPLVFDDSSAITNNPSIRRLWPLGPVLAPPAECTVAGRPFANLTFALNYAWGGTAARSYHAVNLGLHAGAALLLFGIVRRSLAQIGATDEPPDGGLYTPGRDATWVSAWAAAIWAVNPLLTAAVTYISQRTEVLMAFCTLLTIYAFLRGVQGSARGWLALSVAACWLGMASKEGMVIAPVLVLLFDATFVAPSFRAALRQRASYYAALAASWVLLAFLLNGLRDRAVGFDLGVTWWKYAFTECQAIMSYLRLVFWPHPLVFDYGAIFLDDVATVGVFVALLATLAAGSLIIFQRWPRVGFMMVAFLLVLAPTSSVVPISAQPIAENRVYLAAAPMIALAVLGFYSCFGRRIWVMGPAIAVAFAWLTVQRNEVYQSNVRLWNDTAARRPLNPRAFANLGEALFATGDLSQARRQFEQAIHIKPDYPEALNNLGTTLFGLGEPARATEHFTAAIRLRPDFASAHNNLGNALLQTGRWDEARRHLEEALRLFGDDRRLKPELPETHNNLGNALLYQGKNAEALEQYEAALRLRPDFPQPLMNSGVALRQLGQVREACAKFEAAIRVRPNFPEAHANLGFGLAHLGDLEGARRHFETAVQFKPDLVQAHQALGDLAVQQGRNDEARRHYEVSVKLAPDDPVLQEKLRRTGGAATPD